MAGKAGRSGRKPGHGKPIEQHIAEGTFRPHRHVPRMEREGELFTPPPKPPGIVRDTLKSQQRWVKTRTDEIALAQGYRFNLALAEHVEQCFEKYLRHSKGSWAGQPFTFTDWQRDELIYPLFGWVRPDGTRRFRRSYVEIPKKNFKSTTASGIGIYMLCCDEEPGAECFSLGADKDQAKVVHQEAVNMVDASEELSRFLRINRSSNVITFDQTRSFYRALSAAPRGKHGLNIHCGIADELHEWHGTELWDSIKYGYRARRQPLHLTITNAGDDMDSVCRKQHEKAQLVIDGKSDDLLFFALILDAPREEAEQEIRNVKAAREQGERITIPVAKRCNPGIGHVISEEDLITDIKDAIDNPSELPNLLRLTYSVWSTGSDPWLDPAKWARCESSIGTLLYSPPCLDTPGGWKYIPGEFDLTGMRCFGGLDLSKNRDFTSFVLMFSDDDKSRFWQLPMYWLPEETAVQRINLAPYNTWSDAGYVRLLDGDVIHYDTVVKDIVDVCSLFDLDEVLYDPWQGEPIRQKFETEGILTAEFRQTITNFAQPTEDYERCINEGTLHHSGNGILTWQAGHCEVSTDPNNNKRPVKRKKDYRTVDGIVAGLMAFFGVWHALPRMSFYDDNEMESG